MDLDDLVKVNGALSIEEIRAVQQWVDDDWESHDCDRQLIKLVIRLLDTVYELY